MQVFGCLHDEAIHARQQQASENLHRPGDIRGLVLNVVREVLAHLRWASARHKNPNLAFPTCCGAIHTLKATPLRSEGTIAA